MIALFATLTLLSVDDHCAPTLRVAYTTDSPAAVELVIEGFLAGDFAFPAEDIVRHPNRVTAKFETSYPGARGLTQVRLRAGQELSKPFRVRIRRWHGGCHAPRPSYWQIVGERLHQFVIRLFG